MTPLFRPRVSCFSLDTLSLFICEGSNWQGLLKVTSAALIGVNKHLVCIGKRGREAGRVLAPLLLPSHQVPLEVEDVQRLPLQRTVGNDGR